MLCATEVASAVIISLAEITGRIRGVKQKVVEGSASTRDVSRRRA